MADEVLHTNGSSYMPRDRMQSAELQIEQLANEAGETVGKLASKFKDSSTKTLQAGRKYVTDNPKTSVAIALMSGFVIGGALSTIIMRQRN